MKKKVDTQLFEAIPPFQLRKMKKKKWKKCFGLLETENG